MDKKTILETVNRYKDAVVKEFSPYKVVLFGSYAKGTADENSDIDVGILFDGFDGDYLKGVQRLWSIANDVSWDIEPHLLDIRNDKSGFAKYIDQTGQEIYSVQ